MRLLKALAVVLVLANSLLASLPVSAAKASIDVLVLYTDEMLQDTPDPDARITLMTNWMNSAFSQSNVDAKVNLVHSQKINFASDGKTDGNALSALRSNQQVAALRQQHGADMVALITKTGPYCGIAYVPGSRSQGKLFGKNVSFSVVGAKCVSAFAHELGHNMGLGHSAAQNSKGSLFDWARGHGINNTFVTTMAYGSAYSTNTTVQRFSNPAISTCTSLPCGINRTQSNGADAARNLNQVASEVAGYFASNGGGSGGNGGNGGTDTEAPTKPGDLKAKKVKENSLKLYWIVSTDNVGVDHYEIFRNNISVGTSSKKNYTDGGLKSGTTYQYHVVAKDKAGNKSETSNLLSVSTLQGSSPSDTTAPSKPKSLRVTETSTSSISLSWNAATDNVAVTGYKVFRDGVEIASNAATSYTDSDNNLAEGATYYYEVKAIDAAGNISVASNRVSAMLKEGTNTPPGAGSDPDNLLQNGHFDSLQGWQTVDGALQQTNSSTAGNQGLLINQRTSRTSGVQQFIDRSQLKKGTDYEFQADIRLATGRSSMAAVLAIPTASGLQLQKLASTSVKSTRWKRVKSTFTLAHEAVGDGYLYFYGPKARYDMLLDEVLLKKATLNAPATSELVNVINNPDFEQSVDGWEAFSAESLVRDTDAHKGQGAAKLSNRDAFSAGLGQSLASMLKPGASYDFSAAVKHTGSNEAQPLTMHLYYQTEGQAVGQWIALTSETAVNPDTWTQLSASLALSDDPIAEAYLLVFGPDENVDLHLDEVIVKQAD